MSNQETITLAGGCFWCLEAVYERVDGVLGVESGYSNGHVVKPTYEDVCGGDTGHAEVVRVSFDPQHIALKELLEIFFVIHDPTTLNRQGNDFGTQYRSGIYVHSDAQKAIASDLMDELNRSLGGGLVTELTFESNYSRAEEGHQHYFGNHPGQGYCAYVVAPKVEKFRRSFKSRYRA